MSTKRMRWQGCAVVAVAFFILSACGDDAPAHPTLIAPAFDAPPCRAGQCSDHGQCVEVDESLPMCLCNVGYAGADCDRCEPGFHTDALGRCAPDRSCAEQPSDPCGLHGGCNDSDGVIMCDCDAGFEGPRCTLCEPGFDHDQYGDCLQLVLGPDGGAPRLPTASDPDDDATDSPAESDPAPALCTDDTCNGHGECDGASGSIECDCSTGYAGDRCVSCAEDYHLAGDACVEAEVCAEHACEDHGDCAVSGGVASCMCDAEYAGDACDECAPGFHSASSACVADTDCLATTCNGHGACTITNSLPTCACAEHYSGTHCATCAAGYHLGANAACVVDETCSANSCKPHGECDTSSGVIVCGCNTGYDGDACNDCATGYHDGGSGTCAADELCHAGTCSPTSVCDESTGTVQCRCGPGYTGEACSACAAGYHRDSSSNKCVPFGCEDNPIEKAGTLTFEKVDGAPKHVNTCDSDLDIDSDDVELSSAGGEGTVWICAESDIYGLSTKHTMLSADSRGPARLSFSGPIASLSFDYGAATALALDVLADGKVVRSLSASARSHGSIALTFEGPIDVVSLRSSGSATDRIALDNIAYAPAECE